jgi:hypothetical protein
MQAKTRTKFIFFGSETLADIVKKVLKKHQNCYVVGVSKQHFLCNENQHNKH